MSSAQISHEALQPPSHADSAKSSSALARTRRNLGYLYDPAHSEAPKRLRTRLFLRNTRYVIKFIFWRLVRSLKYMAVGAAAAAVAGTAFGGILSGAAFFVAPTGIFGAASVGLLWGLGKFGWRTLAHRIRSGKTEGANAKHDEKADAERGGEEEIKPPKMVDPW
ncbi:hypothetical protein LTS18_001175 [Coniosporium uncinatum]|uniref:Uncharacterized protein n=1 Tax=Coniosporium uncinatum TaxID=93489 RepID=A0ACC3DC11_9PEZI|nr:hypothetical protein LTS18_001175 [Coniosporium uncinatum]